MTKEPEKEAHHHPHPKGDFIIYQNASGARLALRFGTVDAITDDGNGNFSLYAVSSRFPIKTTLSLEKLAAGETPPPAE